MKVALILTGYIDGVEESFPHYLRQIAQSDHSIDTFASVHSDTGQSINDLSMFREHFIDSKTFAESESQKNLPFIASRGHPSVAEFAEAVTYWSPQLKNYDIIWRSRWDNYLVGGGAELDAQLRNCVGISQSNTNRPNRLPAVHKLHSVVTNSIYLRFGKPAMTGKHHWVTSYTAIEAFADWEAKWESWMNGIDAHTVDPHLTWANIYAGIKSNVTPGNYTVEKVSKIIDQQTQAVFDLRTQRKLELERKIKG